jgi:hypothetical protein
MAKAAATTSERLIVSAMSSLPHGEYAMAGAIDPWDPSGPAHLRDRRLQVNVHASEFRLAATFIASTTGRGYHHHTEKPR